MEIIEVILTALLSVASLFLITKIMGHKQVAQLDFFDYVSGITIGSIGAELATELESPERPLIALAIYGLCSLLLNLFAHKFPRSRKYINGTPTILFNSDKIYRKNLKKAKLDLSEFLLLCREQGYFDLNEIETAIFEHNGHAILRAVENRRYVVRAANTGLSSVLTPRGEILAKLDPLLTGTISSKIPMRDDLTFFTKHPNLFPILLVSCAVIVFALPSVKYCIKNKKEDI
jgi:uncharacterized membrane protein YcaP (DUF421 family)